MSYIKIARQLIGGMKYETKKQVWRRYKRKLLAARRDRARRGVLVVARKFHRNAVKHVN